MSHNEIISAILDFVLFNGFVALTAVALVAFYLTSRPKFSRVGTAAIWQIFALLWFMLALVSTIWSAPAEKAFTNPLNNDAMFDFGYARFQMVLLGVGFAALGVLSAAYGLLRWWRQQREFKQAYGTE